jgi:hypothetical protein
MSIAATAGVCVNINVKKWKEEGGVEEGWRALVAERPMSERRKIY